MLLRFVRLPEFIRGDASHVIHLLICSVWCNQLCQLLYWWPKLVSGMTFKNHLKPVLIASFLSFENGKFQNRSEKAHIIRYLRWSQKQVSCVRAPLSTALPKRTGWGFPPFCLLFILMVSITISPKSNLDTCSMTYLISTGGSYFFLSFYYFFHCIFMNLVFLLNVWHTTCQMQVF